MMQLGGVLAWYVSDKWISHVVQLPEALMSLTRRIKQFFLEYVLGDTGPSYDAQAASKSAAKEATCLRRKIAKFDNFIKDHPALKAVVALYIKKYGREIVWIDTRRNAPNPSDTVFEKWRKAQSEKLDLEFMWKERIAFVKRHPPVMNCMLEHMKG